MKPHYEDLPTTSTPKQLQDQAAAQQALDQYFSTNPVPRVDHRFLIGHQPTVVVHPKPNHSEAIGYGLGILVAGFIAYYGWKIERKLRAHASVQLPAVPSGPLQPEEIRVVPTKVSEIPVDAASIQQPAVLPPLPGPIPRP